MKKHSKNLGPDAPIVVNAQGGRQSKVDFDFTLLDPSALFALLAVLTYGATRYERDNWRLIPAADHINHMLIHAFAYLEGDTQDDHLGHMLCRAFMATAKALRPNYLGAQEKRRKKYGNKKHKGTRRRNRKSR